MRARELAATAACDGAGRRATTADGTPPAPLVASAPTTCSPARVGRGTARTPAHARARASMLRAVARAVWQPSRAPHDAQRQALSPGDDANGTRCAACGHRSESALDTATACPGAGVTAVTNDDECASDDAAAPHSWSTCLPVQFRCCTGQYLAVQPLPAHESAEHAGAASSAERVARVGVASRTRATCLSTVFLLHEPGALPHAEAAAAATEHAGGADAGDDKNASDAERVRGDGRDATTLDARAERESRDSERGMMVTDMRGRPLQLGGMRRSQRLYVVAMPRQRRWQLRESDAGADVSVDADERPSAERGSWHWPWQHGAPPDQSERRPRRQVSAPPCRGAQRSSPFVRLELERPHDAAAHRAGVARSPPPPPRSIVFHLRHNGRYLCCEPRTGRVVLNRRVPSTWERFVVEVLPTDFVDRPLAQRNSVTFSAYVHAARRGTHWAVSSGGRVHCAAPASTASTARGTVTSFTFVYDESSRSALIREDTYRRYLRSVDDGRLLAFSTRAVAAERFDVQVHSANRVFIRTRWGFVCAEAARDGTLTCRRRRAAAWEEFRLIPAFPRASMALAPGARSGRAGGDDWRRVARDPRNWLLRRRCRRLHYRQATSDSAPADTSAAGVENNDDGDDGAHTATGAAEARRCVHAHITTREGTRRAVRAHVRLPRRVPPHCAYDAVRDYERYAQFCRGVRASRVTERRDDGVMVRSTQQQALWVFCVTADMLLRVREEPRDRCVDVQMVRGRGARQYRAIWHVRAYRTDADGGDIGAGAGRDSDGTGNSGGDRSGTADGDGVDDDNAAIYGSHTDAGATLAAAPDDDRAEYELRLLLDFQPSLYVPGGWLDRMAKTAAREAVEDMRDECVRRAQGKRDAAAAREAVPHVDGAGDARADDT